MTALEDLLEDVTAVGRSNPTSNRRVVVFPDPFGPSSLITSPRRMSNDSASSALTWLYHFERPSIAIVAVPPAGISMFSPLLPLSSVHGPQPQLRR